MRSDESYSAPFRAAWSGEVDQPDFLLQHQTHTRPIPIGHRVRHAGENTPAFLAMTWIERSTWPRGPRFFQINAKNGLTRSSRSSRIRLGGVNKEEFKTNKSESRYQQLCGGALYHSGVSWAKPHVARASDNRNQPSTMGTPQWHKEKNTWHADPAWDKEKRQQRNLNEPLFCWFKVTYLVIAGFLQSMWKILMIIWQSYTFKWLDMCE